MSSDPNTNGDVEIMVNQRALHLSDGSSSPKLNHITPISIPALKIGADLHYHNSNNSTLDHLPKCNGDVRQQLTPTPSDSTPVEGDCVFSYDLSAGRSLRLDRNGIGSRKASSGGLSSNAPLSPILKNRNDSSCVSVRYDAGGCCEVLVNSQAQRERDVDPSSGSLQDELLDMEPNYPLRSPALTESEPNPAFGGLDPMNVQYRNKHVRISPALTELEYVVEDEENALRIKYLRAKAPVAESADGEEAAERSVGSARSSRSRSPGRVSGHDSDHEEVTPFRHPISYKRRFISKRCIKFLKSVVRFMFSHVGLLCLVGVYAAAGALLFPLVEHEVELSGRKQVHLRTEFFAVELIKFAFNISKEMIHDQDPFSGGNPRDFRRLCSDSPRGTDSSSTGPTSDAELDSLRPDDRGTGVTDRDTGVAAGGSDNNAPDNPSNTHDETYDEDMFGTLPRQGRRRRAAPEHTLRAPLQNSRPTPGSVAVALPDPESAMDRTHLESDPTATHTDRRPTGSSSARRLRRQSVRRVRRRAAQNSEQWKWKLDMWRRQNEQRYLAEVTKKLHNFQSHIFGHLTRDGWDGELVDSNKTKWSFPGALLYTLTVITTIGYGHVVCRTPAGRTLTMVYAIMGIPLTLLCVANMGLLMANVFRFIYVRFSEMHVLEPPDWLARLFVRDWDTRKRLRQRGAGNHHELLAAYLYNTAVVYGRVAGQRNAGGGGAAASGEQPSALERIQKETSRLRKKQKVHIPIQLVLVIFSGYWALGAWMFATWEEGWSYFDGIYFCFVTFSTIGFGDLVPGTEDGSYNKLAVVSLYLLGGLAMMSMTIQLLQDEVKTLISRAGRRLGLVSLQRRRRNAPEAAAEG